METIPINLTEKDIKRFWKSVDVRDENECWNWNRKFRHRGYGRFYFGGAKNAKTASSSRIAYAISFGDPLGLVVCHKCDNRLCCNPNHLFVGTQGDNMRDMVAKNRSNYIGKKHESHPQARLNKVQVIEIRHRFASGERKAELARQYGVAYMTITCVVRGLTWKGVEAETL
jgi:hypothetical protein